MTINEAELRKLAEAVPSGEWRTVLDGRGIQFGELGGCLLSLSMGNSEHVASHIAAAQPSTILALLDKIATLSASLLERYQAGVESQADKIATLSACLIEREQSLITAKRELNASYAATPAQPIGSFDAEWARCGWGDESMKAQCQHFWNASALSAKLGGERA